MHYILEIIWIIIYAIVVNPVFWIALVGPRIISMNFKFLRGRLGINYKDDTSPPELKALHDVINKNVWVYAWNDFNTQLFVSIMSFFFILVEPLTIVIKLCKKYGADITLQNLGKSDLTMTLSLLLLFIFIWSITVLISDKLISVDILKKYQPKDGIITGENKRPPKTLLTYYRGSLLIYGLLYSLWEAFVLSDLVQVIENVSKSTSH